MADNILLELQEEARRDELAKFFKKNGKKIYALLSAIVIATAAYQLWDWWDTKERIAAGDKFYSVIDDFTATDTPKKLEEAAKNRAFDELAPLAQAALALRQGKVADAQKLYKQVANNHTAEPALRELASLNNANLTLQQDPANKVALEEMERIAEKGVAFKYTASELLATVYLRNNEREKAAEIFKKLAADKETPASMAGRAKALTGSI